MYIPSIDNLASLSLVSLFVRVDAVINGGSISCWFKGSGTVYGNDVAFKHFASSFHQAQTSYF